MYIYLYHATHLWNISLQYSICYIVIIRYIRSKENDMHHLAGIIRFCRCCWPASIGHYIMTDRHYTVQTGSNKLRTTLFTFSYSHLHTSAERNVDLVKYERVSLIKALVRELDSVGKVLAWRSFNWATVSCVKGGVNFYDSAWIVFTKVTISLRFVW